MPNRTDKRPLGLLLLLRFALAVACAAAGSSAQAGPYLLLEADSGRVISQHDAGMPWYPASVTKLMTVYLAFRAMRDKKLEPNTLLKVSANAMAQPPSKMGFKAGTEVTLDNAIKMLMVRSANDIAVVVAEGIGGDVQSFVHEMNLTAGRLGMSGTRFINPHGLPEDNQVTTARDMAILARALTREFPEFELYFRIPAIQIGKRIIRNHNRLIDRYPGADGMKTGFICSSGFNVVATATRKRKRLIAVVFGSYSAAQRAEDAARLFERGFDGSYALARMLDLASPRVEGIQNLGGDPADLRDLMCNPKRRRPAAESDIDDEDDEEEAPGSSGKSAGKKKLAKPSLLADLTPSMPPIRVFTGPPSKTPEEEIVIERAGPDKNEKPRAQKASAGGAPAKAAKTAESGGKSGTKPTAEMPKAKKK